MKKYLLLVGTLALLFSNITLAQTLSCQLTTKSLNSDGYKIESVQDSSELNVHGVANVDSSILQLNGYSCSSRISSGDQFTPGYFSVDLIDNTDLIHAVSHPIFDGGKPISRKERLNNSIKDDSTGEIKSCECSIK